MKNKKNSIVWLLVTTMICGVALAISSTMSQAKSYEDLTKSKSKTNEVEKKESDALEKDVPVGDFTYRVKYEEGLDFNEGITISKGIEKAVKKIKELHPEHVSYIEAYESVWSFAKITVWDFTQQKETPTLESKASWAMAFTMKCDDGFDAIVVMEVDKLTGNCIEKSYEKDGIVTTIIGRFKVNHRRLDKIFDFQDGITVEKAIQVIEEKAKSVYELRFSNEIYIGNNSSSPFGDKEGWTVSAMIEGGTKYDCFLATINKFTGEITSMEYQSKELVARRAAGEKELDEKVGKIDYRASHDKVKEEILKYVSAQQNSEYYQIAVDFITTHGLNKGATIERVQGTVNQYDTMISVAYEINGPMYSVEVELDNGKYVIVTMEKETKMVFSYYETESSLEDRIEYYADIDYSE